MLLEWLKWKTHPCECGEGQYQARRNWLPWRKERWVRLSSIHCGGYECVEAEPLFTLEPGTYRIIGRPKTGWMTFTKHPRNEVA